MNFLKSATKTDFSSFPDFGSMLIIAPHQDDESLGCGGTIALARELGIDVHVIFTSDGCQSHPASKKFPRDKLIKLRENEALTALSILGVKLSNVYFMRMPDGDLPSLENINFYQSVHDLLNLIKLIQPEIVFLPWRRDPHKDHRATWEIVVSAIKSMTKIPLMYEYFVWLFERGNTEDLPQESEGQLFYIDISSTIDLKNNAVMAHKSQTTDLIDDDPNGFTISIDMVKKFENPKEFFLKQHNHHGN